MSISQIIKLTGEVPKLDSDGNTEQNLRAASAATFQTKYSTYTYKNKKYKVMRVYATPNGKTGPLYKTGNSTVKNSKSLEAIAMNLIKITSSSVAGVVNEPIGIVQTVYGFASEISNYLSKTSVVSDIKGSYTWAAAETCVFVYFQSPTISGAWNLKGQYSKASVAVGVSVPTLKVKGKKAIAKVLQKSYNKTVTPQNYNSTQKAFEAYKNGGTYKAIGISKVNITGLKEKSKGQLNYPIHLVHLEYDIILIQVICKYKIKENYYGSSKVRKIYWICWLLASVIVVFGALLPDEKMQKNCDRYWNNNCYFWKYYCNLFYEMSLL